MPLETDKHGGFKFKLGEELRSGFYPGLFAATVPLWADGQNVQFTDVGVEKVTGSSTLVDTGNAEPIRGLVQLVEAGTTARVYMGDLTKLYEVNVLDTSLGAVDLSSITYSLAEDSGTSTWDSGAGGATWDGATPAGVSLWDAGVIKADQWSMVNYGTFVLATSGADSPQIYKGIGSGNFVNMYGGVTGVTFVSGGTTGYTTGDILTLTGGGGSGATVKVTTAVAGVVTAIQMETGGTGFTSVPTGHTGGDTTAVFAFTVSNMDVSSVEIFVKRGPHIVGFNTSVSPKEFIWCDADDPDDWVTSTTNLAGQLEIRELNSEIMAAVPLGNRIAVYGTDQMFLVNYLGNDLVFGYQPALNGIGAVSKKAVVSVGRHNYGLSEQGFFMTDGVEFTYIDEPAARRFYQENANTAQLAKVSAWHDEDNNQIRWYLPLGQTTNQAGLSYNYRNKAWSYVTGDRSAGDERRVLSYPVSGTEAGLLKVEGGTPNDSGAGIGAVATTKALDLGNADAVKELDSIRIGYIGTGLQYRIGWSDTENGTPTWGDYTDVTTGFGFHNLRTAGRWLFFEIYSAAQNVSWEVQAVEFIGRVEGTR